jgi:hypothetical protein
VRRAEDARGVSAWRKEEEGVPVRCGWAALSETAARAAEMRWQTGEGGGTRATQGDRAQEADEWA